MSRDRLQFSIAGDKHLERVFKQLPARVRKRVVRQAVRDAGKVFLRQAKADAPVLSGKTRKYLKLRVRKTKNKDYYRMRVMTGTREEMGISPQDKHYYPSAVEFGHKGAPPHPFMRPAFDLKAEEAQRLAAQKIVAGTYQEAKAIR